MDDLQEWINKQKRDLQKWKKRWNRYLIVLVVVSMFFGAIVCVIDAASFGEAIGSVFSGAFWGAIFAVIGWFFIKIFNDPRIAYEKPWRQFCSEIGADFVRKKLLIMSCKVVAKAKAWTITFDASKALWNSSPDRIASTVIKAFFVSKDKFRFKIYRSGLFSEFGKLLGMQDIEIGHPMFDLSFIIKSNDKSKVRELFSDTKIRQLIQAQPSIVLGIKTSSSKGMDELYFVENDIIVDVKRLKSLYELFAETLNKLHHIGSA